MVTQLQREVYMRGGGSGKGRQEKKKERKSPCCTLKLKSNGGWIKQALIFFLIFNKTLAPLVAFQNVEWV